jgi:hypothetical protein
MWWFIGVAAALFFGGWLRDYLHERKIQKTLEPGAGLGRIRK